MNALDMALDDLAASSKQSHPARSNRRAPRGSPYTRPAAPSDPSILRPDTGSKIIASHLPSTLTYHEIHALFSTIGRIRKLQMNHDQDGKFVGNCIIIFYEKADGARAVERFHGVTVDGMAMKIEVAVTPMTISSGNTLTRVAQDLVLEPVGNRRGGGARGSGGGGMRRTRKTAEELDAEMEDYVVTQSATDPAVQLNY